MWLRTVHCATCTLLRRVDNCANRPHLSPESRSLISHLRLQPNYGTAELDNLIKNDTTFEVNYQTSNTPCCYHSYIVHFLFPLYISNFCFHFLFPLFVSTSCFHIHFRVRARVRLCVRYPCYPSDCIIYVCMLLVVVDGGLQGLYRLKLDHLISHSLTRSIAHSFARSVVHSLFPSLIPSVIPSLPSLRPFLAPSSLSAPTLSPCIPLYLPAPLLSWHPPPSFLSSFPRTSLPPSFE